MKDTKQSDGRSDIGVTDRRRIRISERLSELFQISSAELVAILQAVLAVEGSQLEKILILTDSMTALD